MSRRVILRSFQSPGDVLMLTAAVRDLHLAQPGKFETDVRTSADALWLNNLHITRLNEHDAGVETIECHYPLVHQANSRPYHFIHGYAQFLEQRLGVDIPLTRFAGDIHLTAEETARPLPFAELGLHEGFWILIAGGKYDFTAKWWDPAAYQAVVDHFQGRIQFAQCGETGHWHPRLKGVIDLVGRTALRDFIVLMHHAAGVLCPVTFAMHLAAAVPTRAATCVGNGRAAVPQRRPCVVVAGAREPAHWEQYPGHQFLHTLGSLPCCLNDPCWRSRCQLVGDGDEKDRREVCERPVQLTPELRIPECMAMITPDDVIRAIGRYLERGNSSPLSRVAERPSAANVPVGMPAQESRRDEHHPRPEEKAAPRQTKAAINRTHSKDVPVLIDFRHGLGDAVQLTTALLHLRHYHPDWKIDVAAGIGKLPREDGLPSPSSRDGDGREKPSSLYRRFLIRDRDAIDRRAYHHVFELSWDECPTCYADSPSTKAEHCLDHRRRRAARREKLPGYDLSNRRRRGRPLSRRAHTLSRKHLVRQEGLVARACPPRVRRGDRGGLCPCDFGLG
jgi:ADP-heptose:LPS heptosyltransferase